MMKKSFGLITIFVLSMVLICSCSATQTIYSNTYLGIPTYNTFINFDSTKTFSTLYRSSNTWILDSYQISIQNANLTVTELFEQTNELGLSIDGSAGTTSTLSFDCSNYGFNSAPTGVDVTGDIVQYNVDYTGNVLTLTTDHNDANPVLYTIAWATNNPGGGGGVPPTGEDTNPIDDITDDIEDTIDDVTDNINQATGLNLNSTQLIIIVLAVIVIVAVIFTESSKKKNSWKKPRVKINEGF